MGRIHAKSGIKITTTKTLLPTRPAYVFDAYFSKLGRKHPFVFHVTMASFQDKAIGIINKVVQQKAVTTLPAITQQSYFYSTSFLCCYNTAMMQCSMHKYHISYI